MAANGSKWLKRIAWSLCILLVAGMALNWLMTYKLKDSLRKHLRSEIINATDSLYDFSFRSLDVGLFDGELAIHGLSLFPDSAVLEKRKQNYDLPDFYFDVNIDTIYFRGINLTWRLYYRELSFSEFRLKEPSIRIISPQRKTPSFSADSIASKDLFNLLSPYFDVLQAEYINFEDANVEYEVIDTTTSYYKLQHFQFTAYNFILDKNSQEKGKLLYSDNFTFQTNTPQSVFDSEYLQFNLDRIKLNTIDSLIYIGGAHLQTKDKYWQQRFDHPGNYSLVRVNEVEVDGITFGRKDGGNFLDSRNFTIKDPEIEYYNVSGRDTTSVQQTNIKGSDIASWSLYTLTSPILERLSINKINIADAKFRYGTKRNEQLDLYTLNNLNFNAYNFVVDSTNSKYNLIQYVQDFTLTASDVQATVASNNSLTIVEKFGLSTIDKNIRIAHVHFSPITSANDKNKIDGYLEEFQADGIKYNDGLETERIRIIRPDINFTRGIHPDISGKKTDNKDIVNNFLDAIAPFIHYLSVKNITVENGSAVYTDQRYNSKYRLSNLDFYGKNFHLDKETRRLRDYFFSWDEYNIKFRNFDNITPDQKHRIQIAQGEFNSISKDVVLEDLKITPQRTDTGFSISLTTPYIRLLGLDEKELKNKELIFGSLVLEKPIIEIVKNKEQATESKNSIASAGLQLIKFDELNISSPTLHLYNIADENSSRIMSEQLQLDTVRWVSGKDLSIANMLIQKPDIDIKGRGADISLSADNYLLESLFWNRKENPKIGFKNFDLQNPTLSLTRKGQHSAALQSPAKERFKNLIAEYANEMEWERANISNLNFRYYKLEDGKPEFVNKLADTDLLIENLHSNLRQNKIEFGELAFRTHDIDFSVADSFYTFTISSIDFSKKREELDIDNIHLKPNYPKFSFAHIHPSGADWFNVQIDKIKLSGIDANRLINDSMLLVKKMRIDHVLLENLKNQKIDIEHNKMPLLYEQVQKLPLKFLIEDLDIKEFTVLYEELARNGYQTARIPFSGMSGRIRNFTNIQQADNSYYTLKAKGLLMGNNPFIAEWQIPVDSLNDKFFLSAQIGPADMRDFNQLIRPMAPAYVKSGRIDKLSFHTEASSIGAVVDMEFVYDSLHIQLLNNMFSDEKNKLYTQVVNRWAIKSSNSGSRLRTSRQEITRDPYHSTFNYFWQILQPPLIESVGITDKKKNTARDLISIYNRIKRFFGRKEKEEKKPEE